VSCRDGRVGGENRHGRRDLPHVVEGLTVTLHQGADKLQDGKGAVALIHVDDTGSDTQLAQRPHAPDAKDQLLADSGPTVSAVQAAGQRPVLFRVAFDVRIEQEQKIASDAHLPDAHPYLVRLGPDSDAYGLAVLVLSPFQRQDRLTGRKVVLLLPAAGVERLIEVSIRVGQAYAHHRDA